MPLPSRITIEQFSVRNFRSIRECTVDLPSLTFLVGANSSGKTSFLEALGFVSSIVRTSVTKAVSERRGVHSILHYPPTFPSESEFTWTASSSIGRRYKYGLTLLSQSGGEVSILRERCHVRTSEGTEKIYCAGEEPSAISSAEIIPLDPDITLLARLATRPALSELYDLMTSIVFLEPTTTAVYEVMRKVAERSTKIRDALGKLKKETSSEAVAAASEDDLTARFKRLQSRPERLDIVLQYLRAIAPYFDGITISEANGVTWLRFVDKFPSGKSASYDMATVSSGLLHSADLLANLFDSDNTEKPMPPIVIEEPEALLHPGAIHVLRESFIEASSIRQVLITSHSPELLDEVSPDSIRSVYRDETGTHIVPLDDATKSVLEDRLYTPGELLRQGGLIRRLEK